MPDLIYNVKFNIDSSETEKISAPIDGSSMAEVEQLKQEIEELRGRNDELVNSLTTLEETMNRVGNSSGKAAGRVGNVGNQSRKTGKRIGDLNKQTAAFNQTIFAFGDLAQDTIQFQYGIATGMRAIGNNIGFAAELFANAALNVRRYNEAVETGAMGTAEKTTVLKAFGQSLFGVGGLILAVNAATTAVTFFTAKMEESKSEVNEAKDVLKSYAGEVARLKNVIGEDPLGVAGISLEMRALQDAVQGNAFGIQRSFEGIREAAFSFGEVIDSYNQKYEGTSFFGSLFDLPSGLIELSVGSIMASLDALTGSSAKTARVIGILSTGISQASVVGGAFANSILNATVQIDGFVSTTGETSLTVGRVNELLKDMNDQLDRQNLLLSVSPLLRYQKDVTTAADTLVLFSKAGYDNEQQIRSQVESLKAERDALVGITVQLDESSKAYKTNVALISILIKAIANLEGQLDDGSKSTKDFSDELFDVSTRIRRAVFEASQFETISRFGDASGEAAKLIFGQAEALESLAREIEAAKQESPQLVSRLQRLMDVVDVRNQQQVLEFAKSLSEVFDSDGTEVDRLTKQYEENRNALELLIDSASGLRETSSTAIDDSSLLLYKQSIESVTEQLDKLEQKKVSGDPLSDVDLSTYDALKLRLQSLKQSYDSLQEQVDVQIDVQTSQVPKDLGLDLSDRSVSVQVQDIDTTRQKEQLAQIPSDIHVQTDVAPVDVSEQEREISSLTGVHIPISVANIDVEQQKQSLSELTDVRLKSMLEPLDVTQQKEALNDLRHLFVRTDVEPIDVSEQKQSLDELKDISVKTNVEPIDLRAHEEAIGLLPDINVSSYVEPIDVTKQKEAIDAINNVTVSMSAEPLDLTEQKQDLSALNDVSISVNVEPIDVSSQKRALLELQKLSDVDAQSLIPYYSQEAVALAGLSQEITSYKSELSDLQRVQQSGQALTNEQVLRADALSTAISMTQAEYDEQSQALQKSIDATQDSIVVTSQLEQMLRNLEQGYEDAKQAIEDKTRAEYADLIASEQALYQYGKAYQQAVMFVREHDAALAGLSPQLQALEMQYASLAAQNLVQSLIGQFDTGEDPMDKLNRQLADTKAALNLLADSPLIDQDQLDAALLALEGVGLQQKELIENQKTLNDLQAGIELTQAVGQLAEVFGATKQFQYAMALTSGAMGIIMALTDPTEMSTLRRFALAASVAAATAVQIKQIADTEIGSTGNVQAPDVGSFGAGSSMTQVQAPTQNISFAPTAQNDGTVLNINNQVLATNKGLALITRAGEREIANSQKTVA